jgi:uncharacterized membrane protein YdjX (TVP38/TMEM64 family)/rhodanese-related sulfurtransferase
MNLRRLLPRVALALLVAVLAVAAALNRERLDPAALDAWVGGLGGWAPLSYVAIYALATIAFVPGTIFGLAGGALFRPIRGTIFNLLGATCGATVAFLVARYLAADWIARKAGGRLGRLIAGVEAEGWRFVAFVRLVPLFPFNLSNYALGLTRVPLGHYVLASLVCMAPGTIGYTWLGYAGREALTGDAAAVRYGLLGPGLLVAIAFLPRLLRRLRGAAAWVEVTALKRRLDAGEPVTVVDVRGPDEFTGPLGHIPEARNLPVDELSDRVAELGHLERRPVILVCRTDRRSARAAEILRGVGIADVAVLRGGMEQWNRAGLPIESRLAQEGQEKHRP